MTADRLRHWLIEELARRLSVEPGGIEPHRPLSELGLSSEQTVEIAAALEDRLGRRLGPEVLYDHPTLEGLVAHLMGAERAGAMRSPPSADAEPIAIVGIGCRFPGAGAGPDALWKFLLAGGDAVRETPHERWDPASLGAGADAAPGTARARWGAFLQDIDLFDASAFVISPQEAAQIDPQQRLLLEAAWHAIEDSGRAPADLAGSRTGVFVGISQSEYLRDRFHRPEDLTASTPSGNALSIAANRISYTFDLRGPSLAVDTACSSSLMAVHLACQSLRRSEVEFALAGGVNVLLRPDVSLAFAQAGLMAADGRCKAFDDGADGYVRGEGVGLVALKRLSDALADGDEIYAQILGVATVQDGRSNGLMAPRGGSQEAVVEAACGEAGISPAQIGYIEAHGTGTAIGDVIEAAALGQVFARAAPREAPCWLGSIKSNIGHLESAAGVAGLIKAALCLKHRTLTPSLHFKAPNRAIPFADLGLRMSLATQAWDSPGGPRIAGVSSFGFGGANVHAVLAEPPPRARASSGVTGLQPVLALSAHDLESVAELAEAYADRLGKAPRDEAAGLVAAAASRADLPVRLAVTAPTLGELDAALRRRAAALRAAPSSQGRLQRSRPAFVFTGQGAIWAGAGRDLFDAHRTFRESLLQTDNVLREHLGRSILPSLFSDQAEQLLKRTEWAQPALFALQVGLGHLLGSWGVVPGAVVGHSAGAIAAAHMAGQLSLEDAARLIVLRSQAMADGFGAGRMAVLAEGEGPVRVLLDALAPEVSIAATNSPRSTVISGPADSVTQVVEAFRRQGVASHALPVDYAFHSALMDAAATRLAAELGVVADPEPRAPYYSSVSGRMMENGALDAGYWRQNVRAPVRFDKAITQMWEDGHRAFVEIGPHPALLNDIQGVLTDMVQPARAIATLHRQRPAAASLGETAAALYEAGALDSLRDLGYGTGRGLSAPPLPWAKRSRHWTDPSAPRVTTQVRSFVEAPVELAFEPGRLLCRGALDPSRAVVLADHRVLGETVAPAAAYLDMFLRIAGHTFDASPFVLESVRFLRMLILTAGQPTEIQVTAEPVMAGAAELAIYARRPGQAWTTVATAVARQRERQTEITAISPGAISSRCFDRYPGGLYYDLLAKKKLEYGQSLWLLADVHGRRGESLGRFVGEAGLPLSTSDHVAEPAVLDGAFHVMAAAFGAKQLTTDGGAFFLPQSIDRLEVHDADAACRWTYCRMLQSSDRHAKAEIVIADASGRPAMTFHGFKVRGSQSEVMREQALEVAKTGWLYDVSWSPAPPLADEAAVGESAGAVLVLHDGVRIGRVLADACGEGRAVCVEVRPGSAFRQESAKSFVVDPGSVDQLREVLRTAPPGGWDEIIHAWSCSDSPAGPMDREALAEGPVSLAWLVQAIETSGIVGRPRLTLLTRGAVAVGDGAQPDPLQAMAWGLARTVVLEHPNLEARRIDLDPAADLDDPSVRAQVRRELIRPNLEDQVALRNGARFVARLRRRPIGATRRTSMDPNAAYLITGGDGALGGHVARALADLGAKTLVFAGRRSLPGGWQEDTDTLPGVRILRATCDIGDEQAVAEMFVRMGDLPPLRGVVHAAGVIRDTALLGLDKDAMRSVLAAKVCGIENLKAAAAGSALDFFVAFSSAASILGSPGQVNYCAANAYMDAFAQAETAAGRRTLSISWGAWLGEGMADFAGDRRHSLAKSGLINMIPPEVGADLFVSLLASDVAHLAVLPFSVRALVQFYPSNSGLTFFTDLMPDAQSIRSDGAKEQIQKRPALAEPYVAPRNEVETAVVGMWERALGMVGIGVCDELFALGGDSVFASQILSQVNQAYGIRIDAQNVFESFTVERLSELIDQELMKLVEGLDEESVERALADGGSDTREATPAL